MTHTNNHETIRTFCRHPTLPTCKTFLMLIPHPIQSSSFEKKIKAVHFGKPPRDSFTFKIKLPKAEFNP